MSHLLLAISGSVAVLDIVAWLRQRVTTLLPLLDKWGCSGSGLSSSSWSESSFSPPECFSVLLWTDLMHQEKQPGYSIASLSRANITTKMEASTAPKIIWSNMFLEVQHYPLLSRKFLSEKTHWDNRITLHCHIVQACLNAVNKMFSSGIFCKIVDFNKVKILQGILSLAKMIFDLCNKVSAKYQM